MVISATKVVSRGKGGAEIPSVRKLGIGKPAIGTEVRGQALLGEEHFVDQLVDHLKIIIFLIDTPSACYGRFVKIQHKAHKIFPLHGRHIWRFC